MKYLWIVFLFSCQTFASLEQDKEAIKSMSGCYKVVYQNAETFSPKKDYEFHKRYSTGGLEWIFVDAESDKSISLQHLLIHPDNSITKHWRQEWRHEDKDLLSYEAFNKWVYQDISFSIYDQTDHWTQATFQVDDSPRYECSAPWVRWNNLEYWECKSNAPLPRREFSVRSDYNILRRNNRHEINMAGFIHSGEAEKISRAEDGKDTLIALEMGKNTYTRVDKSLCNAAKQWWPQHEAYWRDVRAVWEELYAKKVDLAFHAKIDGKVLWEKLFDLDQKYFSMNTPYNSEVGKAEIRSTIYSYLK
ncbi:MAG: hypothetical protein JNM93_05785 [Bacteriovoracaceae bacterium]|nr:hypothetical protein [Bacteriovoracaceae bacterium]